MTRNVYICTEPFATVINGARQVYSSGRMVLDDDPVQPAKRGNFEEICSYVERTSRPPVRHRTPAPVVEEATAVPGEKRRLGGLLGPRRPDALADEQSTAVGERPPISGAGSTAEAWREYAANMTDSPVDSWASLSRAEIIELLDSEGADHGQA